MTGLGGYCYIIWGIWLRHCLNGRQNEYKLHWPRLTTMPVVIRTESTVNGQANGEADGRAKKEL